MSDLSREEAIKILQALKFIVDFENYSDRVEIALGMAIEALKREKRALQLRSIVRNIDGWQNIVDEVARIEAEERGESNERDEDRIDQREVQGMSATGTGDTGSDGDEESQMQESDHVQRDPRILEGESWDR